MRIMHVTDRLSVGGKERVLVDLAGQTLADGHGVSVCIIGTGDEMAGELAAGIPAFRLGCGECYCEEAGGRFRRLVDEDRPSLLHVHGRPAMHFVALAFEGRSVDPPVVFHDHHGAIITDRSVPKWFPRLGRRTVSRFVGVCDELGVWAESAGIPREHIRVIANGLNFERLKQVRRAALRKRLNLGEDAHLGIVVCGWRRNKGLEILLDAVEILPKRRPLAIVLVGGDREEAYARAIRERMESSPLKGCVLPLGERRDVPAMLGDVDFAVHPARTESGPLVLIEYAAAGVPFVASRVGDVARRLEQMGYAGFVPPSDSQALAEALDRLLRCTPEERARRGACARERVSREFDIRNRITLWYEVYADARRAK